MDFEQAFPVERVSGSSYVAVLVYFPLGIILAIFRLFLTVNFLCSQIFFNLVFSKSNFVRRAYEKVFLTILGVVLVEKETRDDKSILVSNSLTRIDSFFITILSNCYVERKKSLSLFLMDLFRLHAANLPCKHQLHVRPESQPTDGKSLLKFSDFSSSFAERRIQPVAVKLYRPLSVAGTTIESSLWSDLFWMYFSIMNVYEMKYLPILNKNENETNQDFVERIREKISEELKIKRVNYDASDIKEFIRRRNFQARKPQEHLRRSATSSPLMREMVQQVKDVLPHVPTAVIISDLERTRSVDVTVTNLLEGVVSFVPEIHQPTSSPSSSTNTKASPNISFTKSTKKISHNPSSFQEKKEAFIKQARENYLKKRGLL